MQAIGDIFQIWPSVQVMAADLNREYDTVLAWRTRKRIPEDAWLDVIGAAQRRGRDISAADLLGANRPPKKRGRPAHKRRSRQRLGTRAS